MNKETKTILEVKKNADKLKDNLTDFATMTIDGKEYYLTTEEQLNNIQKNLTLTPNSQIKIKCELHSQEPLYSVCIVKSDLNGGLSASFEYEKLIDKNSIQEPQARDNTESRGLSNLKLKERCKGVKLKWEHI